MEDDSDMPSFWSVFQAVDSQGHISSKAYSCGSDVQQAYSHAIKDHNNFELRVIYSRSHSSTTGTAAGTAERMQEAGALKHGGGAGSTAVGDSFSSKGVSGQLMLGMLEFRFSHNTGVDHNMQLIGVPNFLPSSSEPLNFYFATLKELGPASDGSTTGGLTRPASTLGSAASAGVVATKVGASSGYSSSSTAGAAYRMMPNNEASTEVRLGPLLGKGAFGRVFRGMWNGAQVAIKIIKFEEDVYDSRATSGPQHQRDYLDPSQEQTPWLRRSRREALQEGLLQSRISHPNIVRTFHHFDRPAPMTDDESDDGHDDGDACASAVMGGSTPGGQQASREAGSRAGGGHRPRKMEAWLVLEFCNRGCVADAIYKGWFRRGHILGQMGATGAFGLSERAVVATAREIASAMAYLHHEGILHGDLTGSNVLLTASSEPLGGDTGEDKRKFTAKVSDFGLSHLVSDDDSISTTCYGTATHMAPEVLIEERMGKASDVYSFGVVLWEMIQGHRPYPGLSHGQVLQAVGAGRLLEVPSHTPESLKPLLAHCLDPQESARPRFSEILHHLEDMEKVVPW